MYYFIINPRSKTGKGMEIWGNVQQTLRCRNIQFACFFTKYRGHAGKLAKSVSAVLSADDVLVIIGGDGTVNEVLNGLTNLSAVTLGYIPTGSGNDFARGMGIPANTQDALELILHPVRIQKTDIGYVKAGGRKKRFGISTGLGFDASICYEALSSPLKSILNKLHLGKLTYACIAIKQLLTFCPADMEITLDNSRRYFIPDVYFTAVMNQPYEGGGFRFCPLAKNNDRCLDVIVVSGLPKWKVLLLFPTAFWGNHTKIKGIRIFRCAQIRIKSTRRYHSHTDGEFNGMRRQFFAALEPEQIHVITS